MTFRRTLVLLPLVLAAPAAPAAQPAADRAAAVAFFETKVRPLLAAHCSNCHAAETNSKGGLRVDDRNGLLQGGNRGPAVVPGHPEKSLLLRAVRHAAPGPKMPPSKRLSDEQIAVLERWVKDGAAWPAVKLPASFGRPSAKYEKLRKEHWAWQPLRPATPPAVRDAGWPRSDIDRFVLARLDEKGLAPVADADRATLLRRLTFDLTGLPPAPGLADGFLRDRSPGGYEKLVDRLLASPAFGERWGRHWLDVARYAESTGPSRNVPYPHAWRYRDYVLDGFNRDKPYDQFLLEQVAGDLLPAGSAAERAEHLVATGFLAVGGKDVNQRFKVRFVMDNIDEQIDTLGRAVLGLTVGCARCHDHKFDPIPTTDYYALAGIFHSTELCAGVRNKMGGGGLDYYAPQMFVRVGPPTPPDPAAAARLKQLRQALAGARAEFQALRGKEGDAKGPNGKPRRMNARQKMNRLQNELQALTDPAANGPVALGVREAKVVGDTEVRVRGEAEKLGPVVPRGFLSLLDVPGAAKVNPAQSGRLELARWLGSPNNPLTARVMANRVWHHLFGRGIVRSVDNFGATGDRPSHPELLDHLAARFVREGWSVKKLVRAVVLSRAYRLGGDAPSGCVAVDPGNRLHWRHAPRRLEAEEIRDAMLAAAGTLDLRRPAASPAKDLRVVEMTDNGPEANRVRQAAAASKHRSVYLPLLRGVVPTSLEAFDFAEQSMVTGRRDATTVAPQALYLLNDPFVRQQALGLARRVLARADLDQAGRIRLAYRLAVGRPATARETDRVRVYLAEYQAEARTVKQPTPPAGPKNQARAAAPPPPPKPGPRLAAWASFCQALLGSAEFRYLR
jgi:cytochrome c553